MPQNLPESITSSSPKSSSFRKTLSSHGNNPTPVSAANTAASWGLFRV